MNKNSFGVFEIVLPAVGGVSPIAHNSKVKVSFACRTEEKVMIAYCYIKM